MGEFVHVYININIFQGPQKWGLRGFSPHTFSAMGIFGCLKLGCQAFIFLNIYRAASSPTSKLVPQPMYLVTACLFNRNIASVKVDCHVFTTKMPFERFVMFSCFYVLIFTLKVLFLICPNFGCKQHPLREELHLILFKHCMLRVIQGYY